METKQKETRQTDDSVKEITDDPMEELVGYMAPVILGKADQTIFCQVNGENIRIKRGEKVKIKRKVKEVLDNAEAQEMAAYAYMEGAQRGSSKALADLNKTRTIRGTHSPGSPKTAAPFLGRGDTPK